MPTIAIEKVYVYNNTSIMQDEVLCHRLGLVPLKVDPRTLNYRRKPIFSRIAVRRGGKLELTPGPAASANAPPHVADTLVFNLRVRCDRIPGSKGETDPRRMYYDSSVYTGMLEWEPSGDQKKTYRGREPKPVVDDVLLVKLRPGQVVDMYCFAHKGIGADHAKFSPVGTSNLLAVPRSCEGDNSLMRL